MFSNLACAQVDNWQVDGEHGELQVIGELTESACRLDMASANQTVDLGTTATGQFNRVGEQAQPVAFQLRFRDCIRVGSTQTDNRNGDLTSSAIQPVVAVTFMAPADADNAELVKVAGNNVSGIALRLTDNQHRDVRLGSRGLPMFLTPGDDSLTYYVVPERTSGVLKPGAYRASVNFGLSYD
ncbi:type 1 fimbrial protein [Serratia proteamaculans]|nr:type 1 fimbrial protein [Serratia proteamaculans]